MPHWILVFVGGGIGSVVRYGIGRYFVDTQITFPLGTLIANLISCFILGMLLGMQGSGQLSDQRALLLMTGFCGGFSTFSTFSAETIELMQNNQLLHAGLYIFGSLILGFIGIYMGIKVQATL